MIVQGTGPSQRCFFVEVGIATLYRQEEVACDSAKGKRKDGDNTKSLEGQGHYQIWATNSSRRTRTNNQIHSIAIVVAASSNILIHGFVLFYENLLSTRDWIPTDHSLIIQLARLYGTN